MVFKFNVMNPIAPWLFSTRKVTAHKFGVRELFSRQLQNNNQFNVTCLKIARSLLKSQNCKESLLKSQNCKESLLKSQNCKESL